MRRGLTDDEIKLATSVFRNSIDYTKVKVHCGRLIPFFQHEHIAMSPFGTMHFPPFLYENDFARASLEKQHLFIHEMAHIWQHQRGLKLWLDGMILACKGGYQHNRCYRYHHAVSECHHLNQFNMEQQASLIADYFVFGQTPLNPHIRRIMRGFVENPNSALLLPKHTDFKIEDE